MIYAYVHDLASSWEEYRPVGAALVDPPPSGLILHIAGPTDEGVRVIEVWASEEAWEQYRAERLASLGGPSRPEPIFRDLRPEHVVVRLPEEVSQ